MKPVKVKIKKVPLGQLISSAYAVYRKETDGNLIGKKYEKKGRVNFIVKGAQASQLAKRECGQVLPDAEETARLFAVYPHIGSFHSHVPTLEKQNGEMCLDPGRVRLSKADVKRIEIFSPGGIEVIVALNEAKRMSPLRIRDYLVSGCVIDRTKKYRVEIGAYFLNDEGEKRKALLDVSYKDAAEFLRK